LASQKKEIAEKIAVKCQRRRSKSLANNPRKRGQKVIFSIRSVKGSIFVSHVYTQREALKAVDAPEIP
jgi:hypothetical protein